MWTLQNNYSDIIGVDPDTGQIGYYRTGAIELTFDTFDKAHNFLEYLYKINCIHGEIFISEI